MALACGNSYYGICMYICYGFACIELYLIGNMQQLIFFLIIQLEKFFEARRLTWVLANVYFFLCMCKLQDRYGWHFYLIHAGKIFYLNVNSFTAFLSISALPIELLAAKCCMFRYFYFTLQWISEIKKYSNSSHIFNISPV